MAKEDINKYAFIMILLVLLITVFLIIRPFITSILASFVLAYIFYPVYLKLNQKIKKKTVSALIVSLLIVLIFSVPFVFLINTFVKEINLGYVSVKKSLETGNVFGLDCKKNDESSLCKFSNTIKNIAADQKVKLYLTRIGISITTYVTESVSKLFISVPKILLNLFIILFLTYYLFKDGKKFFFNIISLLPIKPNHKKDVIKTFNEVIYATIYGQVIVAIVQGVIGGIGFYIFGVGSPVLWGGVMVIFSLFPYVGSSIIWVPASLFLFITGLISSTNSIVFKGIGLFLYGLIIISTIDNIIKPRIVGKRAKMHPALVFIGVLGGLFLFGFIGILLGPLIIAVLIIFARIYQKREFL